MYSNDSPRKVDVLLPYANLPFVKSDLSRKQKEDMVAKFHPDRWREPQSKEERQAATEILAFEMMTT